MDEQQLMEMYKKIKEMQEQIIKAKLQNLTRTLSEGNFNENTDQSICLNYEEINRLFNMLDETGFKYGKDYVRKTYGYGDPQSYVSITLKLNGRLVEISSPEIIDEYEIPTTKFSTDKAISADKLNEFDFSKLGIQPNTNISRAQSIKNITQEKDKDDSVEAYKAKATEARENLVRAKLREIIKDMIAGKEQSSDNSLSDDHEIYILLDMLKKAGLEEGKDFIFGEEAINYNDYVAELFVRIGDNIFQFSEMNSVTDIISATELEGELGDNQEYYEARLLKLQPLELESLGISVDSIQQSEKEDGQQRNNLRQQFEETLLRDDVVEYYMSKTPEELKAQFGPEVARMVGFEQKNAHHCYDLWGHTLYTVASVDTTGLTEEQAKKLKVAAFFHDIGKPDVVGFNPKTKQQNFFNHAVHSVDIARPILEQLGYSKEEIAQIGFFIGHHDDFLNYKPSLPPKDKSHAFFREITPNTVGEIVVQNKYDFDRLGFPSYLPTHTEDAELNARNSAINNANKLKIRHICSALQNNGIAPVFRDFKGKTIDVSVDMGEVQSKAFSGEYDAEYIPSLEDYQLLLELCKADARAQSELVKGSDRTGKEIVVDSRKRKLETMEIIGQVIPQAYRDVDNRDKFLASILRSANRRVEVRNQNAQAAQLAQDYEQQMPSGQPSLDDN